MTEWSCESCVHYPPSSFGGKPCWMCNTNDPLLNRYEKREEPVITNAERIRAMSDEELARKFNAIESNGLLYGPCGFKYWLDWLQSPAGGDGDG